MSIRIFGAGLTAGERAQGKLGHLSGLFLHAHLLQYCGDGLLRILTGEGKGGQENTGKREEDQTKEKVDLHACGAN